MSAIIAMIAKREVDVGIVLRPLAAGIEHRFVVGFPKGLQRGTLVAEFARAARHVARETVRGVRHASASPSLASA